MCVFRWDSLAEELQQLAAVLQDLLAPGVGLGAVEQEGPAAQLLLEDGPEGGLGTQNLKPVDSGVDPTLQGGDCSFRGRGFNFRGGGV